MDEVVDMVGKWGLRWTNNKIEWFSFMTWTAGVQEGFGSTEEIYVYCC